MDRNRLLIIAFVALMLGVLSSFLVYRNLQSRTASTPQTVPVVVAANDISVGARIGEKDIKVVRFPVGELPSNYFRDPAKLLERGVVLPIAKGDFILPNKLAGENAGSGLPSLIPPGMRAVSVRVNEVVGVAGYVQPGTRVDVLMTGNPTGAGEPQTITVLKNVAVIASGQKLERGSASDAQVSPVITLLVSPDDAQRLALASNQGRIQLALRNPLDTNQTDIAAANTGNLYRNGSSPAPATAKARPKHAKAETPLAPAIYSVEMIRGEKRDVTKFP